ncbi:hypothetical protein [Paracidobacterium acidisoli]|uniref:Uncharacterized protein n=1 Tax=Paracidobacterium acidisoli TaxID=2303751 RepID=A0A372IRR0_9BACT|nr:hypothetical protein [Paracidobacterium acidisoli]MBT9330505.1 hypothetical protein [Paracidobacterium acidisoli]
MNFRSLAAVTALVVSPVCVLAVPGIASAAAVVSSGNNGLSAWTAKDIAQVTGRPFSATRVTTQITTGADGSPVTREISSKIVRDSSGRVRVETPVVHQPDGAVDPSHVAVQVYDPVGHTLLTWTTSGRVATLIHLPSQTAPSAASSQEVESLGSQAVNNMQSEGQRVMQVVPAGTNGYKESATVVAETWTSPELKVPLRQTIRDPRHGTVTTELSGILQHEPDPSLFAAPAGYAVHDLTPPVSAQGAAQ